MYHLRQLQCAVTLADLDGHFSRAADHVGITQSGFTQSIQRLEDYYGVPLFVRRRAGATPTAFGAVVIAKGREILAQVANTRREIDLLRNLEVGHLLVGADPQLTRTVLAPALASLLESHSKLRFSISTGGIESLEARLIRDEIEVAVGFPAQVRDDAISYQLIELPAPIAVAAPDHPQAGKDSVPFSDLFDYPLVSGPLPQWFLEWAAAQQQAQTSRADLRELYFLHSEDMNVVKALVMQSHALMAAMEVDLQPELGDGRLKPLQLVNWPEWVTAAVMTRKDRVLPPAASALLDHLLS